jgi:Tol biopolymer transport system component
MPREFGIGRPLGAILLVGLLAMAIASLPTTASATVAFELEPYGPEVWVSPNEDGSEARHVGNGWVGQVSPDGKLVAFEHGEAFGGWELRIYNTATRRVSVRLAHMRTTSEQTIGEETALAWSPDSTKVAALQEEPRSGEQTLYVIGVRGGKSMTRIARGHFRGVSFSPDGKQVVFGLAHTEGLLPKTDIARAPATGGPITLLTHDGVSGWPLWGPRGQIAFSKRTKVERFKSFGEPRATEHFDLFTMKANGGRVKRLTKGGSLEAGFFPAFWLPSGNRMVANFESLGINYAALVNLKGGTVKPIDPPIDGSHRGVGETGFLAASLSADGQTVLGCFGSVVFANPPMASVPLSGGEPTILNQEFSSPSWSGVPAVGTSPC